MKNLVRAGCATGKTAELKNKYFLMPNELFALKLKPREFMVYAYLRKCVNNTTYQCWPSYQTIARATDMSKSTVKRCIDHLTEMRLIDTERTYRFTKTGMKVTGNLLYTVLALQEAETSFYEHQLVAAEQAAERQKVRETAAEKEVTLKTDEDDSEKKNS